MRIRYNSPVVLTFTLFSTLILAVDQILGLGLRSGLFVVYPDFDGGSLVSYFRLFSHVLGHQNWAHLLSNFAFILLIGPMLEEKHGSGSILLMMVITALVTGLLNVLFLPTGLMGASGIVFMMILLSSFTNIRAGEVPLTFILVVVLFLTREVVDAFRADTISQLAHIAGGICGAGFGFLFSRPRNDRTVPGGLRPPDVGRPPGDRRQTNGGFEAGDRARGPDEGS